MNSSEDKNGRAAAAIAGIDTSAADFHTVADTSAAEFSAEMSARTRKDTGTGPSAAKGSADSSGAMQAGTDLSGKAPADTGNGTSAEDRHNASAENDGIPKVDLLSLYPDELESLLVALGEPKFRAKQLFSPLQHGISPEKLTTIGKATKEKLSRAAFYRLPTVERKLVSAIDGTVKYLFRLCDGNFIESVLMKYKETGQEEGHSSRTPVSETFSPEQVLLLLKRCQRDARSIYLPMLLAVTAGLTVPEIIGIKFEDVDLHNQIIYLPNLPDTSLCSRPDTVILHGNNLKAVFLSDLVADEIRLQKKHLETLRQTESGFNAAGYMVYTSDGQQRKKRFVEKPYARMLSRCRLPAHPWKNFRKIQLNQYGLQKFTDALAPQNPLSQASYKLPFDRNFLTGLLN